ncbi:MAG: transporter, partial [Spirochaetota bacterium]
VGCRGDMYMEASYERIPEPGLTSDLFLLVSGYSLNDRFEVSAEMPYVRANPEYHSTTHGIGDVLFSGKYLLLGDIPKDGSTPQGFLLSLKGAVKTRSGDADRFTGSGENEQELSMAMSRCFGFVTAHVMAGYTWITHRSDETRSNYYLYGYAMEFGLSDRISLACEITGQKDTGYVDHRQEVNVLAGALLYLDQAVILDLFASRSIVQGEDFNSFGLGGTMGF